MKLTVGDLFQVGVDDKTNRLFQYICDDSTQLGSQVVRVFETSHEIGSDPNISEVLQGDVLFHSHVFLKLGVKLGFWAKIGTADVDRKREVLFRDSSDYGNPDIAVSKNWFVWKINGDQRYVGALSPEFESAEIGVVVPPDSLVHRIRHGSYDFAYPGF